jgi:hypothetical protein
MYYMTGRTLAAIYTETLGIDPDAPPFQRARADAE